MSKRLLAVIAVLLVSGVVLAEDPTPPNTDGAERPHHKQKDGKGGDKSGKPAVNPTAGEGDFHPFKELLDKLNLSEDQKKQVRGITEKHRAEFQKYREAHHEEFKAAREKLEAAQKAKDEPAIRAAREEIRKIYMAGPTLKAMGDEIRGVLTDDQKKTFDAGIDKIYQRIKEQMEKGAVGSGKP